MSLLKKSFWQRLKEIALTDVGVLARGGVDADALDRLEQTLLEADFGVPVTVRLVEAIRARAAAGEIRTTAQFQSALASEVAAALRAGRSATGLQWPDAAPAVFVVLGVNGAGKTTFIGKLSAAFRHAGKKVLLGAADTFRAGAIDQLRVWAERAGVDFVGGAPGSDPASVAFDAVEAGITRGADIIIVDTAGRLHTSDDLMTELRKIHRVIGKRLPDAPHEILLVLDGTIGQNALSQARTFSSAVPVTGIVVTKLDGTAKGGIVVAVHETLDVPIKFVGLGEQIGDLEPFDAAEYARELVDA